MNNEISQEQYENALRRIEELLPLVSDDTDITDTHVKELISVSDIVERYEKKHYPISGK